MSELRGILKIVGLTSFGWSVRLRSESDILHLRRCKMSVKIGDVVNRWKSGVDEVANR